MIFSQPTGGKNPFEEQDKRQQAREMRLIVIQDQYTDGNIDFEQAMELLNAPLSPDDPATAADDRFRLLIKSEDVSKATTDHLRMCNEQLYGYLLNYQARRILQVPLKDKELDYDKMIHAAEGVIKNIDNEIFIRLKKGVK